MKRRRLLVALLLSVSLCFISVSGYGEVKKEMDEEKVSLMRFYLLWARVNYTMDYPTTFLGVNFVYDSDGKHRKGFPESVDTKGKICVQVFDNRDAFNIPFYKSKRALLEKFKEELEVIYSYIDFLATDMDTDIVAKFYSEEGIPLGYFYEGEYHLWEK